MASRSQTPSTEQTTQTSGFVHLAIVYVVWSSTYLGIRIAVQEGSGFPPFSMAFMRAAAGGIILMLWSFLRKHRIRPTRAELGTLIASGLLLWTGGNGLVTWAEQRADSGLAALLVASMPIWAAFFEAIIDRKIPSGLLVASLLIGFTGTGLLAAPSLTSGVKADSLSTLALFAAPISWSIGSILITRRPVKLSPQVSSGFQMMFGSIGFLVLVILLKEPIPSPTTDAWLAWGYLVVFGSLLAYTSYITALGLLPINIVMTYAYVNPVIAVLLGSLVLQEEITGWTIAGSMFVLLGVAGVFRERFRNRTKTSP